MRKILMISMAVLMTAGTANAISRYNSTSMSCSTARSLVANEGAVIFRYPASRNPSLTLYDRFVRHGGYCAYGEYAGPKAVPTTTGSCTLLACLERSDDGFIFRQHYNNGRARK